MDKQDTILELLYALVDTTISALYRSGYTSDAYALRTQSNKILERLNESQPARGGEEP